MMSKAEIIALIKSGTSEGDRLVQALCRAGSGVDPQVRAAATKRAHELMSRGRA